MCPPAPGPWPWRLSPFEMCHTAFPLMTVLAHEHCCQWERHLQKRTSLVTGLPVCGNQGRWEGRNTVHGEQTADRKSLSLALGNPSRDSSSPFLTSLAWLPSILGKHPCCPTVRGLADYFRKLGRSKCIFTRTARKPRTCFINVFLLTDVASS